MITPFALVITVCMLAGDCHDEITGVYESEFVCHKAALEDESDGQCYPVEEVVTTADDQQPAFF